MKLINYAISLLLLVYCTQSIASWTALPASRHKDESFKEASDRAHKYVPKRQTLSSGPTAEDLRGPVEELDVNDIPEISSMSDLVDAFNFIRDTKFINDPALKFPRRLSWLYPDDGCFVRAELAAQFIKDAGGSSPKKMYAFGNLQASTMNTKTGSVSWWYHVAVTYRVGTTVYIFDPAINSEAPLTLKEWHEAIGGKTTSIQYSICSAESFDPISPCEPTSEISRASAVSIQIEYLNYEWRRLQELRRDPVAELGEKPPWRH